MGDKSTRRGIILRNGLPVLLLALVVFFLHFQSLHYGLFMDDHAHFRQLQECDWSLSGLTGACRLELVGGVAGLWFMPDCTLRFFRPIAFGLMKLTYTLGGWDPLVMHVASLCWHVLTCTLLMYLLRRLGGSPWLSWAVAVLFAAHPGHVATVEWIACQTELMVTAFLLAATLCYLRFRDGNSTVGPVSNRSGGVGPVSNWSGGVGPVSNWSGGVGPVSNWSGGVGPVSNRSIESSNQKSRNGSATNFSGHGSLWWAIGCVLCYALALGCRENALMFPLVLLGIEYLLWHQKRIRAYLVWGGLVVVALGYLIVRNHYLDGAALPPKPYVIPPGDPDFLRFIFDKACYYLLGEFLLAPCIPFAGMDYLRGQPVLFYSLSALVILIILVLSACFWRRRPGLLGPAWLLGFMAPLLPVFTSPHHLYLPGIGWAIIGLQFFRGLGGNQKSRHALLHVTMWLILIVMGIGFGVATLVFGRVLGIAHQVEDQVAQEVVSAPRGLNDGDTLYIANLPLIAHYVGLNVERRTGLRDLNVQVLTWSPRVLGLAANKYIASEISWIDERTIDIRVIGDRYFSGSLGRMARESLTTSGVAPGSWPTAGEGFTVEVLEQENGEISALRFRFDQPLTAPGVHLFWGSRLRWANELRPVLEP
ncbi:MAG: hypothetical protein ABIG44_10225 [Planctomycetota bacterium]